MTASVTIVRAGPGDRDQVLALVETLLRELEDEPDEFEGLDRTRVLRDLAAAGDRWNAFLARGEGGRIVGLATVVETFAIYAGGNYGVIDEMFVLPGERSRGTGACLIEAVKDYGRGRGWVRVDVTAPPGDHRRRTVRFYESQGFVFTGPKLRCRLVP